MKTGRARIDGDALTIVHPRRGGCPDGSLFGALHVFADVERSLGASGFEADGSAVGPGDAALGSEDSKVLPDGLP